MGDRLTARQIVDLLRERCPALIHELVPGARREGNVFSAPNPTRSGDARGSFKIWMNGAWKEYDEGVGGDILGLVAYVGGHDPKSRAGRKYALAWAKERLGLVDSVPEKLRALKQRLAKKARERDREESARAQRIYLRALDIRAQSQKIDPADADNPVVAYLAGRGVDLAAVANPCPVIRFHPGLEHWTSEATPKPIYPAMVTAIYDAAGLFQAVHCTFLARDAAGRWGKAPVANAKLMLGHVKGCFAPLTYGASGLPIHEALAAGVIGPALVCEGVETGLALALAAPEARVWACLSLSNIANAPVWLGCVESVVWARENDVKAQAIEQAERVGDALAAHGKPVIGMRPIGGNDFADMAKKED